jgi:hypothetical protein
MGRYSIPRHGDLGNIEQRPQIGLLQMGIPGVSKAQKRGGARAESEISNLGVAVCQDIVIITHTRICME